MDILDPDLRNAKSYSTFRKSLLKSGRPSPNHIYKIHDPLGLKLLTRLRLGLSHLNEHRFNHNFDSCINPSCSSSLEVESTKHFIVCTLPPPFNEKSDFYGGLNEKPI